MAKTAPEPIAPDDAIVNAPAKDFIAGDLLPWARTNQEKLKAANEWCKNL